MHHLAAASQCTNSASSIAMGISTSGEPDVAAPAPEPPLAQAPAGATQQACPWARVRSTPDLALLAASCAALAAEASVSPCALSRASSTDSQKSCEAMLPIVSSGYCAGLHDVPKALARATITRSRAHPSLQLVSAVTHVMLAHAVWSSMGSLALSLHELCTAQSSLFACSNSSLASPRGAFFRPFCHRAFRDAPA
jgi:hypothetical protein